MLLASRFSLAVLACLLTLPLAGQEAPEAFGRTDHGWQVQELGGRPVRMEQFRGRVVFLNVWASWCRACVDEMPSIQALHDSLAPEGIAFLAVAAEGLQPVQRFIRRHRLRLPVYLEDDAVPVGLGVVTLPTTLVIDHAGTIVLRHRGAAEWDRPEVRQFLRALVERARQAGREARQ